MGRKNKKGDPISGWVNLNKPYGMTSTQAIGKLRRILNAQKIGHAGTLDPLATGVLPIALGEATKTIPFVQDDIKVYRFTVTWGESRDTDDMEGKILETSDTRPTQKDIENALPKFMGEIDQIPPLFSAIKVNGKRAYDMARNGEIPDLKSRKVQIDELTLLESRDNEADFEMVCGKGTYVRSLARDLAEHLGTKGFISALRRDQVGGFHIDDAILLDNIEDMEYFSARSECLLPLQTALDDIPALELKGNETAKIRNGQALCFVSKLDFERLTNAGLGQKESITALAMFEGNPVALIEQSRADIKPIRIFNV
ncbi:MAG: tRNA pseudouridine(55) synthase TruB [Alphaproteobacteria bacterium]